MPTIVSDYRLAAILSLQPQRSMSLRPLTGQHVRLTQLVHNLFRREPLLRNDSQPSVQPF